MICLIDKGTSGVSGAAPCPPTPGSLGFESGLASHRVFCQFHLVIDSRHTLVISGAGVVCPAQGQVNTDPRQRALTGTDKKHC